MASRSVYFLGSDNDPGMPISGKDFKNKRYLKKTEVILEFNQEAQAKNIPAQMQRAFQYTIQKCNSNNSSIIDYLDNSNQ